MALFGRKSTDKLDGLATGTLYLDNIPNLKEEPKETEDKPKEEVEWMWVEGYKGTEASMMCRDVQFELGKRYDMPEDAKIESCRSGYHLCLNLQDVFDYYSLGGGHRYFKVRALVRASDVAMYGKSEKLSGLYGMTFNTKPINKLAAKSIEFISEVSRDDVLAAYGGDFSEFTEEEKDLVLTVDIAKAVRSVQRRKLVALGYSYKFATYIVTRDKFEVAYAVGSQTDLSMDMKCMIIFDK